MVRVETLTDGAATIALPADCLWSGSAVPDILAEAGTMRAVARIRSGACHRPGYVGVSGDLVSDLCLPVDCPLHILVAPRRIRFGPVVGILASTHPADLPNRLTAVENHLLACGTQGGLFVAFALEGLDTRSLTVDGYHYAPRGKERWVAGRFPLPRVIYRRFGIPLGETLPQLRALGVAVFNERTFHKWEAWQWAASDPLVRTHMPETVALRQPRDLLNMVTRYGTAFVKPIWGSLAAGIVRVRQTAGGFTVDATGKGQREFATSPELLEGIPPFLPKAGIIQQGLSLMSAGGRLVDFRVVVQKDGHGHWTVPGIVGRCGTESLFVSNMATGGFPLDAGEALALLFGRSPSLVFRRIRELTELGLAAAAALESGGLHLSDLGLDMAYDPNGKPWVIEANNRDPDHNIGWEYGNWPMFYDFRSRPLEYACFLDGFVSGEARA